jgi:ribosomal protein S18 acetylase RimI-like enzyme
VDVLLIDVKARLHEDEIQELLGYAVFPDPENLEKVVSAYKSNAELELYGYESEGEIVGVIGLRIDAAKSLTIDHLAVKPECRGAGFGRGLILEAIALKAPSQVAVETDEESVDFYRSIGFEIESLGEKYPGVEHFRCIYDI